MSRGSTRPARSTGETLDPVSYTNLCPKFVATTFVTIGASIFSTCFLPEGVEAATAPKSTVPPIAAANATKNRGRKSGRPTTRAPTMAGASAADITATGTAGTRTYLLETTFRIGGSPFRLGPNEAERAPATPSTAPNQAREAARTVDISGRRGPSRIRRRRRVGRSTGCDGRRCDHVEDEDAVRSSAGSSFSSSSFSRSVRIRSRASPTIIEEMGRDAFRFSSSAPSLPDDT
mmetsp:Transcript_35300/g.81749  ORF Transcript_35300/g.81749 Transcript_35300/m.81749 type:complete len:233 (+) Transcript_35300:670-1368(+)